MVSINDLGKAAIDEIVKQAALAAVFTVRERGNLYMDISDFDEITKKHKIPLYRISDINCREVEDTIKSIGPDLAMCIGWNQIIKKNILSIPKYGWIGSYPTKLPTIGATIEPKVSSAKGNEPVSYTILNGYEKTALSLFWLEPKVDTGDVFAQEELEVDTEHETTKTLLDKLCQACRKIIREKFGTIVKGNPPRLPQELGIGEYWPPLNPDENYIDLPKPIKDIYRQIRASVYLYPNAFIEFGGQRIYIESAKREGSVFTQLKVRLGGEPYAQCQPSRNS